MKIPEHIAMSFLLAQYQMQPEFGLAGTGLMIAAGCLPDCDGVTLLGGWRSYEKWHRVLGHGLPVTFLGPAALAWIGSEWLGWGALGTWWVWLQLALLVHLTTDVCFSCWPVRLLWPLSSRSWGYGWIGWNDLVPTLCVYLPALLILFWPAAAVPAATIGVGGVAGYIVWRALLPRKDSGWSAWLTGDWAAKAHPIWKWLTGDFIH